MPKGKPWTVDQERKLQELVKARVSTRKIASELGVTLDSVQHKMRRLGLKEEGIENFSNPSSLKMPTELFTVEEALLSLAKAMKALEERGLDKTEVLRLRSLVQACKIYQEKFGEYVGYRRIEEELMELRKEVAQLRKSAEDNAKKGS